MKRYHLFEFEDFPWFPDMFKESMRDYLNFILKLMKIYEPVVPLVRQHLERTGVDEIIDMCSGSGGGALQIYEALARTGDQPARLTLTDKYPNRAAAEHIQQRLPDDPIRYLTSSVDATDVQEKLSGLRTFFTAFHHFDRDQAEAILRDAVVKRAPIAVFEGAERSWSMLIGGFFFTLAAAELFTPFIQPFRWDRLLFTYAIPVLPAFIAFDGAVSMVRQYEPDELLELGHAASAGRDDYRWESGRIKASWGRGVTYLLGAPA